MTSERLIAERDELLHMNQQYVAEIQRLRAALKPFAIYAAGIAKDHPGWDHDNFDFQLPDHGPTMRAFRAARAAFGSADA